MVGLVDYGSGSDSDSESPEIKQTVAPSSAVPKRPTKKKFAISLPALSSKHNEDHTEETSIDDRPAKKPRIGSGKSSLLGMLPAPKQTTSIVPPKPRVLGGGTGPGLVFNDSDKAEESTPAARRPFANPYAITITTEEEQEPPKPKGPSTQPFLLPPSLQKRRPNVSLEETSANTPKPIVKPATPAAPIVDFFSLGNTLSAIPSVPSSSILITPAIPALSSAPVLPEFQIPDPTPYDPYPGYYQLQSGSWAAYDADYYAKFSKKWHNEYNAHVRALEKGSAKGFEDYDESNIREIDPVVEMEKAKKEVQEREERKALTIGAGAGPTAPKMKISAAKTSGVARSRHQLSTLLKEAYENREALEERIAEGKRNRKEAGNKYGF